MAQRQADYPATLDIDYPVKSDRLTTFFRLITVIPIAIILTVLTLTVGDTSTSEVSQEMTASSGSIVAGLGLATALMIIFRQRYPKWWFNFALELSRFSTRVGAYILLLTDVYPSTEDKQSVHLDLKYPNVKKDLNRWLPLVKWLLVLPHFIVLIFLFIGVVFATVLAWFAILITGKYPRDLFDFVVGVNRWALRVEAYAFLLITDEYPPFSLEK